MGHRYYGQFQIDKVLNDNFIHNEKRGFFVECGAYDGIVESSCKFFEETLEWRGMNIEAVPYLFNKLKQNRPNSINIEGALFDENTKKMFTQVIHPRLGWDFGNGSLKPVDLHFNKLKREGCGFESFEVNCFRFDSIIDGYNITKIDLFVLDVEGAEVEVLSGILTLPREKLPKVFCIEYGLCGLDNLKKKMISSGYHFSCLSHVNSIFVRGS
jgi:FkbM family methyltransferase